MEAREKQHIYLASPHMSEEGYEQDFIQEAFETNWIAPLGKNVTEFEREVCEKLGARAAVALSSGTAAMHMALKSIGVGPGDVVFCQSLTFAATANPIVYQDADPVFIDSDAGSWDMDPAALEMAFEKYEGMGRSPRAVIVTHLYGLCARIGEIREICDKHGVPLVEDAAESLGTTFGGRHTGTFGDYGIISFNGNKIITSSGGGMLLFNTVDAAERAKKVLFWATQSRDLARWYQHSEIGYNYRMSNVVAGIGRGQLRVLDRRVAQKRAIYRQYKEHLGGLPGLSLMPMREGAKSNCWLTAAQLGDECPVRPIAVMEALEADDVESRPVWKPLHLQPVFSHCDFVTASGDLRVTDARMGADSSVAGEIFRKGVCLPSDTKMTEEDMERVCGVVRRLWG